MRADGAGVDLLGQNRRAAEREVSAKLSARSTNGGEERFSGDQIGGSEPLGEAAVDGGQQLARLAHSAPSPRQSSRSSTCPSASDHSARMSTRRRMAARSSTALQTGSGRRCSAASVWRICSRRGPSTAPRRRHRSRISPATRSVTSGSLRLNASTTTDWAWSVHFTRMHGGISERTSTFSSPPRAK